MNRTGKEYMAWVIFCKMHDLNHVDKDNRKLQAFFYQVCRTTSLLKQPHSTWPKLSLDKKGGKLDFDGNRQYLNTAPINFKEGESIIIIPKK